MRSLTDFGDVAVALPLSVVMLAWLLWARAPGAAAAWAGAVGLCVAATALLKILLYVCPLVPDLVSPSGHTSLSTLVYGALTLVIAAERRGWRRVALLAAGAGLIVAIAASRLALNAHSAFEVAIGVLVGAATLALFAVRYRRPATERRSLRPLILPAVAVIILLHGHELRAEGFLHAISRYLHPGGGACAAADAARR